MKKLILIFMISGLFADISTAQKLLEIYKKGPVKLIPEKNYGVNNNWESLFDLYYDTLNIMDGLQEQYKKIIVAPDGSVFMSHKNRHEIWKFGYDGNFVKKFGNKGGKENQFPMLPSIQPVVDGKYIFTSDVNGRLKFFDLNGNYIKSINLTYIPMGFQPINDGEILLKGFVIWKTKVRYMVVNLNMNTGKEVVVYDYFTERGNMLTLENIDSLTTSLKSKRNFKLPNENTSVIWAGITLLPNGKFIKTDRNSGEIIVFQNDGKVLLKTKMDVEPIKITEEDVRENYEKMRQNQQETIDRIKKSNFTSEEQRKKAISINQKLLESSEMYKDISNYYPYLPYFSNIILDDEGNFLVFEFTGKDDSVSNIFNVIAYDNTGKKLARTSFICDDYDISFSESTFVISKGYVYAVAKLKKYKGMPLRLVKFKITN
jgi:hypothetical protein